MKLNYFTIPLCVFLVAFSGSWITSRGMDWYQTVTLPDWTPPGSVIGSVWTVIFILTAISALIVWNKSEKNERLWWTVAVFFLNGFLNVFWSCLFFGKHLLYPAAVEAAVLWLSVVSLIILIRPVSRLASLLLYPYAIWVAFATYLTYAVWSLNG